jgi:hypothetical protein
MNPEMHACQTYPFPSLRLDLDQFIFSKHNGFVGVCRRLASTDFPAG